MCPECRLARLTADGSCRNCVRVKARVMPGRMPIDGALRTFVAATAVTTAVVFGFRAVIYVLSYLAVGDLRNGDLAAIDEIHRYGTWATIDFWATVASAMVVGRLQRQWMDAGNANALTRPDIGLSWFRGMPSSKTFLRWELTQSFGFLAIVFLNIAFRHAITDPEQLRAWAVLQVSLCMAVIVAAIGGSVSARRMTAQLLERVDLSQEAARTAHTPEPDPIL